MNDYFLDSEVRVANRDIKTQLKIVQEQFVALIILFIGIAQFLNDLR